MVESLLSNQEQNLAIELASGLQETQEILDRYGISKKDFRALAATEHFKKYFKDAKIAWGSVTNARERVALKSAMISEGALLRINQLIHAVDTPPSNVIEAHKHMSNLGQLMPSKPGEAETGNKHSIVINIGRSQGREPITVQGKVLDHDDE